MKEKRRTPNPDVDEQKLINQVHMRTVSDAMGFMAPPSPAAETADGRDERDMEITTESLPAEQRTKATTVGRPSLPEKSRTAQTPRDYDSIFLVPNVLDARKATYIGAEVHNLTKWVVDNIAPDGTSIGGYITRVMEQHYADNWERMMAIYEEKLASRKMPLENASFIKHKNNSHYEYIQYYSQPADC